jgi:hypothetical protein
MAFSEHLEFTAVEHHDRLAGVRELRDLETIRVAHPLNYF